MTADQSSRSLHKKRSDVACVCCGEREGVGGGASSTMTSPANDHLCLIHAPCNMCAFHSFPSYMHLQCTCLTVLAPRQHAHTHTHTKKRCVYHLMPGSILAAGPVSVLESLEVSAVSCQRASAVWRIKSPACLYFSRPLLPWKQVPRISHFFIFLYTIHITPHHHLHLSCCSCLAASSPHNLPHSTITYNSSVLQSLHNVKEHLLFLHTFLCLHKQI